MARPDFRAAILDLDGVITRTATLHARAWKETFDEFLARRTARPGEDLAPFDVESDYLRYVDGKPRHDGIRSFLRARGIELPEGDPDDPPGAATVHGLGAWKNRCFLALLEREGVHTYGDAVEQIRRWADRRFPLGLVTSSRNGRRILEATRLDRHFAVVIDGNDAERLGLPGKPAPDVFEHAAREVGVEPREAIAVEDAISGVAAARAGGFGLVVGIDRNGCDGLLEAGADVVVRDLRDLEEIARRVPGTADEPGRSTAGGGCRDHPSERPPPSIADPPAADASALDRLDVILDRLSGGRLVLFFDYDGTLTPIVRRPELATLDERMRALLRDLASRVTVAVVSGRDLADVRQMVGIADLHYAGSHGFDVAGPGGIRFEQPDAERHRSALDEAQRALEVGLEGIEGAWVERKRFAIAVHFRESREEDVDRIERVVDDVQRARAGLRKKGGKKIFEIQPDIPWDKGRAVLWLLERLRLDTPDVIPVYIGDDVTDEDAFRAIAGRGLGIRVGSLEEPTRAEYRLRDPAELEGFLRELLRRMPG
jgi:trehalose-phosphatase